MSVYYNYALDLAEELTRAPAAGLRLLDYGCGAGKIVELALERGMDAAGVDTFYDGGSHLASVKLSPHWGTRFREMEVGNHIPWPDASFDAVIANQVFEHIDDFATPLAEIARVMRPGAVFINIFPSRLVWREGHIGIPFAHRLPRGAFRQRYALALRKAGFGYNKGTSTPERWSSDALTWIDQWTHYKPYREIHTAFERHFTIELRDAHYIGYRIARHPRLKALAPMARSSMATPLLALASSRLAGHVFVLRKH